MGKWKLLVALVLAAFIIGCAQQAAKPKEEEKKAEVEPIIIGLPLPINFPDGYAPYRGAVLAAEEINAKGGINVGGVKRPIKIEVVDTRDLEPGVPISEALAAVEKLILEKKVHVLVGGPARSEAALATLDIIAKYKVPWIVSCGVLTPAFHKRIEENYDKYKYAFRLNAHAVWLAKENVDILEKLREKYGFNKVYVMVQDVEHARKFGEVIAKMLEEKGWKVVGFDRYPTGTTDFSSGLLKAKSEDADILLIQMDMPETMTLIKQWADLKVPALPIGFIRAAQEQKAWEATEGKVNYFIVSAGAFTGNAPSNATEWTMKFYNAYTKRWGTPPQGHGTSASYMAIYVVADAIERAGSLDPDKIVKALEETDMMGVFGRIRFDPKSHQVILADDPKEGAVTCWFQWQDGKRVTIYPPSIAEGEIKLPPWMLEKAKR